MHDFNLGAIMADFMKTQSSFANGEVSPEFYTTDKFNALSRLENMDVLSSGGISRRNGLVSVDELAGVSRIFSFSVSDSQEYIVVLGNYRMDIYLNDTHVQRIITPWKQSDVGQIQCAQRFDTMIFVHSEYTPQILSKSSSEFSLSEFSFSTNTSDLTINAPFIRFDDSVDITITVEKHSSDNNTATFITNQDFWVPEKVFSIFSLLGCQWTISEYIDSRHVIAITNGMYSLPLTPVSDWYESAFSNYRGWPRSITFHQDRLVFGGSRSWPGGVWLSQVGRHNNFSTGTGLDDEAIFLSLQSQQRQQICTVVSADNLQILTTVGEWAISSKPLTPSSVDIKQHTSVGSYSAYSLSPQKIEGATIFVAANGQDIRELTLDNLSDTYNAIDLCALSKHLMKSPIDIAYNPSERRLYVVRQDGIMAVLNYNASLGISAWATYRTAGQFISVCVRDGKTYVVVRRDSGVFLEYFDVCAMQDAGIYNFTFCASGLPIRVSGHNISRLKLRKISARVLETKNLNINNHSITFPNEIYSSEIRGFTGDVSINLLGGTDSTFSPAWTLHGTEPYSATILSITLSGWYTI